MPFRALFALVFAVSQIANAGGVQTIPLLGKVDMGKVFDEALRKSATRTHLFDREFSAAETNACIESVCGPAAGNISVQMPDVIGPRLVESENFKADWARIWPHIENAVNLEDTKESLFRARADRALERGFPSDEKSVGSAAALLALTSLMKKLNPAMRRLVDFGPETFSVRLNEAAFARFAADLPAHETRFLRELLDRILVPAYYDKMMERLLGLDTLSSRLKSLDDGRDAALVLRDDARAAVATAERAAALFGPIVNSMVRPMQIEMMKRIAAGGTLNVGESASYTDTAQTLDILAFIARPERLNDLKLMKVVPADELAKRMSDLRSRLSTWPRLATNALTKAETLCRANLNLSLARNASGFKTERARKTVAEVRAAAKTVMAGFVDASLRPKINDAIDRVTVEMPLPFEEQLGLFETQIGLLSEETLQGISLLKDESPAADTVLLLTLMNETGPSGFFVKDSRAQKICSDLQTGSASDATIGELGRIHMSWYTVNFNDIGPGIFAHEFGHVMAKQMKAFGSPRNAKYYESLTCTVGRNPYAVDRRVVTPENEQDGSANATINEDWADHFGALILKELARRGSPLGAARNMGCALVNDQGTAYGINTMEKEDGDIHSSALLRLLMIASDRGQVTEACKPLLAYAAANGRALNCELNGAR